MLSTTETIIDHTWLVYMHIHQPAVHVSTNWQIIATNVLTTNNYLIHLQLIDYRQRFLWKGGSRTQNVQNFCFCFRFLRPYTINRPNFPLKKRMRLGKLYNNTTKQIARAWKYECRTSPTCILWMYHQHCKWLTSGSSSFRWWGEVFKKEAEAQKEVAQAQLWQEAWETPAQIVWQEEEKTLLT